MLCKERTEEGGGGIRAAPFPVPQQLSVWLPFQDLSLGLPRSWSPSVSVQAYLQFHLHSSLFELLSSGLLLAECWDSGWSGAQMGVMQALWGLSLADVAPQLILLSM